jgi:hypothetical protein
MRTGRTPYLPSWLPDWSDPLLGAHPRIDVYRLFSACGSEELSQGLVRDGVLSLGSLLFGHVIASGMTLLTILSGLHAVWPPSGNIMQDMWAEAQCTMLTGGRRL